MQQIVWCIFISRVAPDLWCAHYCCWNQSPLVEVGILLILFSTGRRHRTCLGPHERGVPAPGTDLLHARRNRWRPWEGPSTSLPRWGNPCAVPCCRRKTVRSWWCFEEILKPKHNQQHLHFRLCFNAKNVHPSIWLVTKPSWELHGQEEQRSTGSIKSKWWAKSIQLWY